MLGGEARGAATQAVATHVLDLLDRRFPGRPARAVAAYWPIGGELDLRPLMSELHGNGTSVALPVIVAKGAPLVFRRWSPDEPMVQGEWRIPVPAPASPTLHPQVLLIPLVGWDPAGYRLGHGGGYYDRTLATLEPRPLAIGVGLEAAHLETIHPQPHDVPLDVIVTERGVRVERGVL